ncbi:MAG TPA: (2Fe-2S)-binding protein [Gaiellaceae bacterium]|nr:(2Fe-2S)-binding protein [Gaiellaceae bacterium]
MASLGASQVVRMLVNGTPAERPVQARTTLADFLRDDLDLTGTHIGCGHGVCGACTVLLDGETVRSCLLLAVQADGHEITTVEGLAGEDGALHVAQRAFSEEHGLQCGFCTPGLLMTTAELLGDDVRLSRPEIRERISGHLCRCTGYQNIVNAVESAIALHREGAVGG